jgi:hypothetical protein
MVFDAALHSRSTCGCVVTAGGAWPGLLEDPVGFKRGGGGRRGIALVSKQAETYSVVTY